MATGVSESSLRTWERRYGIPQPARSATGRRLYSEDDLEVIRRMAAFVQAGIPASEAASAAKAGELPAPDAEPSPVAEHPLTVAIRDASEEFDQAATKAAIDDAVSTLGWPGALDQVLMPALHAIGRSWGDNSIASASEHFTSELIRRKISAALVSQPAPVSDGPGVLLACPEDERHELGILALCLLLGDRGLRTIYLGADVPTSDLLIALQKTAVEAVCLSATTEPGLATLARAVRTIASARMSVKVFVGGPALHAGNGLDVLGIVLAESIDDAATQVATALAG